MGARGGARGRGVTGANGEGRGVNEGENGKGEARVKQVQCAYGVHMSVARGWWRVSVGMNEGGNGRGEEWLEQVQRAGGMHVAGVGQQGRAERRGREPDRKWKGRRKVTTGAVNTFYSRAAKH